MVFFNLKVNLETNVVLDLGLLLQGLTIVTHCSTVSLNVS